MEITSFLRRKQYICYMITSILMVTISSSSCQVISSKLPDVESLCPETEIILTCLTRGSPLIIWRSMDYIGGANVIDFNELNTPGEEKRSSVYSSTVATLTNISMDNTERILISQLRITIRSDVASTSVICVHNNGSTDKIVLNLLDLPDMVELISDQRENITGCVVHYSWIAPSNINISHISHFMVTFNDTTERVNSTGDSVYMRAHSVCTCAIHEISIHAVDRCRRMGASRNYIVSREPQSLSNAICNDTRAIANPMTTSTTICDCNNKGLIIAISIVGPSLGISLAAVLIVLILKLLIETLCKGNKNPSPEKPAGDKKYDTSNL